MDVPFQALFLSLPVAVLYRIHKYLSFCTVCKLDPFKAEHGPPTSQWEGRVM